MPDHNVSFDDLPLVKEGPPGNAWGLWGENNDLGMLNLLDTETTLGAVQEVKSGVRVTLDWPLNSMSHPSFDRIPFSQTIKNKAPRSVNDDILTFNTQSSSQWDGFRHHGYQKERLYYNGKTLEDIQHTTDIGIHAWTNNGGIVGRGVFLDYAAWADEKGIDIDAFAPTNKIDVPVLEEIAAAQGVTFKKGDILLIRTGWIRAYAKLSQEQRIARSEIRVPPAIGLQSSERTLRWLWDHKFAACAGDQPSFEAWPCQDWDHLLHEWILAGWGLPIGELFDLEKLSGECRKAKRWTFMLTSCPLNVPGGVASPPNAIAIL